jgi:hypothetical protein
MFPTFPPEPMTSEARSVSNSFFLSHSLSPRNSCSCTRKNCFHHHLSSACSLFRFYFSLSVCRAAFFAFPIWLSPRDDGALRSLLHRLRMVANPINQNSEPVKTFSTRFVVLSFAFLRNQIRMPGRTPPSQSFTIRSLAIPIRQTFLASIVNVVLFSVKIIGIFSSPLGALQSASRSLISLQLNSH